MWRSLVVHLTLMLTSVACLLRPGARLYAGYSKTDLKGSTGLQADGSTSGPQPVDLGDVGIGRSDDSLYLRGEYDIGFLRVTGSYLDYRGTGSGLLQEDFGRVPAGSVVNAEAKVRSSKGALTLDVIDVLVYRMSPGVGFSYIDIDNRVSAVTGGVTDVIDDRITVPMAFLQQEVDLGVVGLVADGAWIDGSIGSFDGRYLEAEGFWYLRPSPHFELFAGYRWIELTGEGDSGGRAYLTDFRMDGWFVGGGISF